MEERNGESNLPRNCTKQTKRNIYFDAHLLEMKRIIVDAENKINDFKTAEKVHTSLNNIYEEYKRIRDSFQDTKYKFASCELFNDLLKEKEELNMLMIYAQLCLADVWTQAHRIKKFSSAPLAHSADIAIIFEPIYLKNVEENILTLAAMTEDIMIKCVHLFKAIVNIGED